MKYYIGQKVIVVGRKEWQDEPYFFKRWVSLIGKTGIVYHTDSTNSVSVKIDNKLLHFNPKSIRTLTGGQMLFSFMYDR